MALAIFDLDNTLLAGDSDYLWGKFLVAKGEVDGEIYESTNQRFYDDYKAGKLDIFAFLKFSLEPLTRLSAQRLTELQNQFMNDIITPKISADALALVEKHRTAGDTLLIITATNHFITEPIAKVFGIKHLLATNPEIIDGRYTGKVAGTPCYQDGKVTRLQTWLAEHDQDLNGSWFYSDSHNDLPLLLQVETPIVVDPDAILRQHAQDKNWTILHLHNGE